MWWCCFFQAEDGIRDLVRSRGLGDVYKRQILGMTMLDRNVPNFWTCTRADARSVARPESGVRGCAAVLATRAPFAVTHTTVGSVFPFIST